MATTLIKRTIKRALVFGAYFPGVIGIIFVATIYESSKGVGENNLPGWILILVFFYVSRVDRCDSGNCFHNRVSEWNRVVDETKRKPKESEIISNTVKRSDPI